MRALRLNLIGRGLAAFRRDRRGVSAVEFALIAPVLILTYFGMAELSQAMMAQRRVSHSASAIGDLVAASNVVQTGGTSTASSMSLTDAFSAASTIMTPFDTTNLKLRVTSITGDSTGTPKVDWCQGQNITCASSTLTPGQQVSGLPAGLVSAAGDNVIMAESSYTYQSTFAFFLTNGLTFTEKFYLRPRQVTKVPCGDCKST